MSSRPASVATQRSGGAYRGASRDGGRGASRGGGGRGRGPPGRDGPIRRGPSRGRGGPAGRGGPLNRGAPGGSSRGRFGGTRGAPGGGGGRGRGSSRGVRGTGGGAMRGGRGGPFAFGARAPPRPRIEMTDEDRRRELTKKYEETKEKLAKLNIEEGETIMAEKKAPGTSFRDNSGLIKLDTNIYGMKLKNVIVYRYDVTIDGEIKRENRTFHRDFTKKTKDDCVITDRKNKCREVYLRIMKKYPNLCDGDPKRVYYDLASILWTLKPLVLNGEKNMRDEFVLVGDDLKDENKSFDTLSDYSTIRFEIRQVKERHIVTLQNFAHVTQDVATYDNSQKQFLELATSQAILYDPERYISFNSGSLFLMDHEQHGFTKEDVPDLSKDKYFAIGGQKSIKYVEGPKGPGNIHAALVIDAKKTAFHTDNIRLTDKVQSLFPYFNPQQELRQSDIGRLNQNIKNLTVTVLYRSKPIQFRVAGVSSETPHTKTFTTPDGRTMNIATYFEKKYNIKLTYPHAPMVMNLENAVNSYPMELCFVVENQRVNKNHMSREEDNKMIKACAIPPAQQLKQNHLITKALQISNENEWLKNADISITTTSLKVESRVLPNPTIQFGDDQHQRVDDVSAKWRGTMKFLRPAQAPIWGAYYILSSNSEKFTDTQFKRFLQAYVKECNTRGLMMSTPAEYCRLENNARVIEEKAKQVANNNGNFILFITSKAITELHKPIKFFERRYEVVTQDVNISTVIDIVDEGRSLTLENIVQKTNMKLGGLNYSLMISEPSVKDLFGTETMYIGLAMSHPGSVGDYERPRGSSLQYSAPSVVGYSANVMKHPFEFVGDCVYGEPRRDEKMDVISGIVRNCLKKFRENRLCDPLRIIIYRNGTSEGQFGMVLQFEYPIIKHALKAEKCDALVTLIVPNRAHNIRLFQHPIKPGKATEQNILPGTIVDTGIVHPKYCEFYLNSHQCIKGTSKAPRYTVLIDENNLSMDALEGMTHHLAFGHQIVNLPTGLPSPVYIASEYADRGQSLFKEYKKALSRNAKEAAFTLDKITQRLCYYNSILGDVRVNA